MSTAFRMYPFDLPGPHDTALPVLFYLYSSLAYFSLDVFASLLSYGLFLIFQSYLFYRRPTATAFKVRQREFHYATVIMVRLLSVTRTHLRHRVSKVIY